MAIVHGQFARLLSLLASPGHYTASVLAHLIHVSYSLATTSDLLPVRLACLVGQGCGVASDSMY